MFYKALQCSKGFGGFIWFIGFLGLIGLTRFKVSFEFQHLQTARIPK